MRLFTTLFPMLFLVGLMASPALARPGKGHHGPPIGPKLHKLIEKLDLDEATAAKVRAQFAASREASQALREQKRAAKDRLRELMEAESPDRAAVMAQVEEVGRLKTELKKQRMGTMLDVRALLTPEQRAQLKTLKAERWEKRKHKRRGKWKKRGGGDDGPDDE